MPYNVPFESRTWGKSGFGMKLGSGVGEASAPGSGLLREAIVSMVAAREDTAKRIAPKTATLTNRKACRNEHFLGSAKR